MELKGRAERVRRDRDCVHSPKDKEGFLEKLAGEREASKRGGKEGPRSTPGGSSQETEVLGSARALHSRVSRAGRMGWGQRELGPEHCVFFLSTLTATSQRYESHFIDEETDSGRSRNLPEGLPDLESQDSNPHLYDFKAHAPVLFHTAQRSHCRFKLLWQGTDARSRLLIPQMFSRHTGLATSSAFCTVPAPLLHLPTSSVIWCELNEFTHPFVHSLNKYLSTASFVSSIVLGAGDTVKIKPNKSPSPHEVCLTE